jgi:hypothetical protein
VVKKPNNWLNLNKRETVAYDAKVSYFKKSFGQKCMDYLDPAYFNSMPVSTKRNIVYKYSNAKKLVIK